MDNLQLNPRSLALVLIDLQKGIVAQSLQPRPSSEVVANAVLLCQAVRAAGGIIVLVHVNTPHPGTKLNPIADAPVPNANRPADWAEFVPELAPRGDEVVIEKRQWGAFYGTEMDLQLRRRKIDTILLAGIATPMGVESTARDAYERGYEQVFVEDAMTAPTAAAHRHVVEAIFPRIGRVRSTAQVLAALSPVA